MIPKEYPFSLAVIAATLDCALLGGLLVWKLSPSATFSMFFLTL